MKKLKMCLVVASVLFSTVVLADKVTVNGRTFQCSNVCSVTLGPPVKVQDCCGGTVGELQRDAIVIE